MVELLLILMMEVNIPGSQTEIISNVCITIEVIVNLVTSEDKLLLKHVQKEYADQKNVHLDILNHVKIEKTVNF